MKTIQLFNSNDVLTLDEVLGGKGSVNWNVGYNKNDGFNASVGGSFSF